MFTDTPNQRCEECGGSLVEPQALETAEMLSQEGTGPDYVCIECQRPHSWRGDPARLIADAPAE